MNTSDYLTKITNGIISLVNDDPTKDTVLSTTEYFAFMYFTEFQSYFRNYKQYKGFFNYNNDFDCYDIDLKKQDIDDGYYITKHFDKLLEPLKGRVIVVTTTDLTKCISLD